MNVVEKLGITPGPYTKERIDFGEPEHRINAINPVGVKGTIAECYSKENARLFAAAPEMLEALIEWADDGMFDGIAQHDMVVKIIEKATGKTWQEIKELLP